MTTAVVIGSGPNGLAAGIVLARAGLDVTVVEAEDEIGGGMRSAELTVPGVLHDVCSAAHPTGVASPFFSSLDLERHGLTWRWAEVEAAHPLDGGRGAALRRDVDATAASLGADADAWRRLFAPLVERADAITRSTLAPLVAVPPHPLVMARFGALGLPPSTFVARRFETEEARALFAGLTAHAVAPHTRWATGAIGLMFGLMGQAKGWPVAEGGSAAIARALTSVLTESGGRVVKGERVTSLPDADVVMFDTAVDQPLAMLGDRLPRRVRRALERWRPGPGLFKIDLAVDGGIPWQHPDTALAGTVHVGGTLEEIHAADSAVNAGRMPQRPFVMVCQQYLADPARSNGSVHPVLAYAHVPHGYTGDATQAILDQLERFAPGTRDRVVGMAVTSTADLQAHNANYLGGDVTGGEMTLWQTVARPRLSLDPYRLGVPGLYLCSSATPPGGGVHGMAGFQAATRAVSRL
ncbi:NAD(P)/FAD-dependent oxidoreductase [Aeromicrobium sp. Leaf350]|uniref:phytoene desaturase family protein n=1 Tax=Aeromicrobium sp. Leaf350 TaxID=2876565 RepID=UPI001E60F639|nr:NAD(P)/FAD-dependent oxidoreductase [Aeromicrobium sp. Leaf350]